MFFNFPGFQPQFFSGQGGDPNENEEERFPGEDFEDDGDYEDIEEEDCENCENLDKKLYEVLEIEPTASEAEIKTAFKKKVLKYNCEKGADNEKNKEIAEAYEILIDPALREAYDKKGMKGVEKLKGKPASMDFFGDFFSKNPAKQSKKTKAVLKELSISLEQAFLGKSVTYSNIREVLCENCGGKGGSNVKSCENCKSRGILEKQVMMGPGMYQFITVICDFCKGQGSVCEESDICEICKGKRTISCEKPLEIQLPRGVYSEFEIKLQGEGDQQPGLLPGDLFLRVKVREHEVFRRNGADLFLEKEISLVEALCGTIFQVFLLDGTIIAISTQGQVINPNETKVLKGKGMPFCENGKDFGNLYVVFKVAFPKTQEISQEMLEELAKILPQERSELLCKADKTEVFMEDFDENLLNTNPEGGKASEEEQEFEDEQRKCGCTTQ